MWYVRMYAMYIPCTIVLKYKYITIINYIIHNTTIIHNMITTRSFCVQVQLQEAKKANNLSYNNNNTSKTLAKKLNKNSL